MWNLLDYRAEDYANVPEAVNELNYTYKFIRFYADTTDDSITASIDVIVRENAAVGEVVFEALVHMAAIIDEGYATIQPYKK